MGNVNSTTWVDRVSRTESGRHVVSRISNIYMAINRLENSVIRNVNSIWSDFIFQDVCAGYRLVMKGFTFLLLGQDILNRCTTGSDFSPYNSFLLIVVYKGKVVNIYDNPKVFRNILKSELLEPNMIYKNKGIALSIVEHKQESTSIYTITNSRDGGSDRVVIDREIGSSLVYIPINVPYLCFGSISPIRHCNTDKTDNTVVEVRIDSDVERMDSVSLGCSGL